MSESTGKSASKATPTKHVGGCHCGAVRFEATVDTSAGSRCNCSICSKTAQLGASIKPDAFRLTAGEDSLSHYEWGSKFARRFFCRHCGIHCFGRGYLDVLGGDFVSVNFNCIDGFDPLEANVTCWDGRHNNWQAGARSTPWPMSKDVSA